MTAELLRLEYVTKRFPGVVALDSVSFDLRAGEVHVLLGENGAGKSTLIKLLSGAHEPDSGRIVVDGRPVRIGGTRDAERLGIGTIYQDFNLIPDLTVAENVQLGRQPRRFGLVSRPRMRAAAAGPLAQVGLDVDPDTPVRSLGVARQQLVEIAKALSLDARMLILDEPTAALTREEAQRLFTIMRRLRGEGRGLIFISHHLEEIHEIGDRVTVLRDGRYVDQVSAETPDDDLVRLMVGRSIDQQYPRRPGVPGAPLLQVRGLTRRGAFENVSFDVHAGEVVGLAGLVGAGRTEVVRALFGADPYDAGEVVVGGAPVRRHDIRAALRAGLGLVPEDRKTQGLILGAPVADNLGLVTLREATRVGFVDGRRQRRRATEVAERLRVRMAGLDQVAGTLSGGNQQKVAIGKWLLARSAVLILDEPTRGIDVGAKVEIYELINELTAADRAVLMVSSELPEVLGMCDRILVMAHGRLVGELARDEAAQDRVMSLAVKEVASSRAH